MDPLHEQLYKQMQAQISKTLEACFIDSQIYGSGFMVIEMTPDGGISLKRLSSEEMELHAGFVSRMKAGKS